MIIIKTYILFDLEAIGEDNDHDFMEIVEIAAHKAILINNNRNASEYERRKCKPQFLIIDSFQTYIKPIFHSKMSKKLNNLLNVDMETLNKGKLYEEAMQQFIDWAGEDAIFVSWSDNDRKMIEENDRVNFSFSSISSCITFLDLQKEYDKTYHKHKRTGLSTALSEIGVKFEGEMHSASADSLNMLPIVDNLLKNNRLHIHC